MSDYEHSEQMLNGSPKKVGPRVFKSASNASSSSIGKFIPATKGCTSMPVKEEPQKDIQPKYHKSNPVYNLNECDADGHCTNTTYYVCCSRRNPPDTGSWQYRLKRRPPQEGDDELSDDELFVNGAEGYVDEEDLEPARQLG